MNLQLPDSVNQTQTANRLAIADCDIHHSPSDFKLLYPYLEKRWHAHIDLFGSHSRQGNAKGPQYPKGQPDASRRDAWPPGGGRPGSNLEFTRRHHLDPNGIELGVLTMIRPHPGGMPNLDLSAALCRGINDWQVAEWTTPEPRLKASIVVPYEDAAASVAEIERWAGSPHMVQVLLLSRTLEPLGSRRYWPIYEAAAAAGLPVGIHAFGNGGNPTSSTGWASYYIEDMVAIRSPVRR
jgi:predicted TIM-barrel fold metal-dependent hydrolase